MGLTGLRFGNIKTWTIATSAKVGSVFSSRRSAKAKAKTWCTQEILCSGPRKGDGLRCLHTWQFISAVGKAETNQPFFLSFAIFSL
jgi:hypothetical protein